jgi:hypothetical protein
MSVVIELCVRVGYWHTSNLLQYLMLYIFPAFVYYTNLLINHLLHNKFIIYDMFRPQLQSWHLWSIQRDYTQGSSHMLETRYLERF